MSDGKGGKNQSSPYGGKVEGKGISKAEGRGGKVEGKGSGKAAADTAAHAAAVDTSAHAAAVDTSANTTASFEVQLLRQQVAEQAQQIEDLVEELDRERWWLRRFMGEH
jgi:hypothetical protein